eukprot:GFYU01000344.1.p1 GENE.GFYU01000344.1~~GFYU01000344.1.p1  ORF type:complete len:334 (-),score=98.42 GFYU01000344.1:316-1317(-)
MSVQIDASVLQAVAASPSLGPIPRKKSAKKNGALSKEINYNMIAAYFDRPIKEAAEKFGCCVSSFKKICRRNGIKRWPRRELRSFCSSLSYMNAENQNCFVSLDNYASSLPRAASVQPSFALSGGDAASLASSIGSVPLSTSAGGNSSYSIGLIPSTTVVNGQTQPTMFQVNLQPIVPLGSSCSSSASSYNPSSLALSLGGSYPSPLAAHAIASSMGRDPTPLKLEPKLVKSEPRPEFETKTAPIAIPAFLTPKSPMTTTTSTTSGGSSPAPLDDTDISEMLDLDGDYAPQATEETELDLSSSLMSETDELDFVDTVLSEDLNFLLDPASLMD